MSYKIKKYRILVFINRKLISYDNILPFLFELNKNFPHIKIEIWFPDTITYQQIKKNIFLYDCGSSVADFHIISNPDLKKINKFLNKIKVLSKLLYRIFLSFISNITFIHFRLLDEKPFNIFKFLNYKNTYFAENDAFGFTEVISELNYLKKTTLKPNNKNINFLQFSEIWRENNIKYGKNKNFIKFGIPKKSSVWINYIKNISEQYMRDQCMEYKIPYQDNIVPIMLGYMGSLIHQRDNNSSEILFTETLEVLAETAENSIILLKPHVITDMNLVNKIIKKFPNLKIFITYLHPIILATHAKFVIVNDYSNSINDFKIMGAKTIEYSSYNARALKITSGNSARPEYVDYFINHDISKLKDTIKELLVSRYERKLLINNNDRRHIFKKIMNM